MKCLRFILLRLNAALKEMTLVPLYTVSCGFLNYRRLEGAVSGQSYVTLHKITY